MEFKYYVIHTPTEEISEQVQKALFAKGYGWGRTDQTVQYKDNSYLFVEPDDFSITYCDSLEWVTEAFNNNPDDYKVILPFQISSLPKKKNPIVVGLNDSYAAAVHEDKVIVGCQEFNFEVIKRLYEAVQKMKE